MAKSQAKRFTLLPQEHTVLVKQTSKWGQLILLTLVTLGASIVATGYLYRIDEIITTQGKLVAKEGGVDVMSPITGKIQTMHYRNGDYVEKGELLVEYDVKDVKIQLETLEDKSKILKARHNENLEVNSKSIQSAKRNISLTEEILYSFDTLAKAGAISKLQYLQQANRLEEQKDNLEQLLLKKQQIMTNNLAENKDLKSKLKRLNLILKNKNIYAPISGIVFDNKINSSEYVAQTAQILLKIIPRGDLSGEVSISNKDIGFIQKGQAVKVRVDSFPFTEYGDIDGMISNIGADALPPNNSMNAYHFPVSIDLAESYLETREGMKISLQAGMTITTNVKLRDRRLIELLGDLFTERSESLKRLRKS